MSRERHLMPHSQRLARVQLKQALILRFLRDEIWADARNIGELLQIKPAATYRSLEALTKRELLRSSRLPIVGGHLTLWGMTAHGQAMATQPGEPVLEKVFAPSRVSARYARHILDIQWLRIRAERAGWTRWIIADRIEKWAEGQPRPDAFVVRPDGQRIAVECERTIKSPKRYEGILNAWLQAIRRGEVQQVVWVCPDISIRDRLKAIVTGITHTAVAGQTVLIPRDRFNNLAFLTFEEWPDAQA